MCYCHASCLINFENLSIYFSIVRIRLVMCVRSAKTDLKKRKAKINLKIWNLKVKLSLREARKQSTKILLRFPQELNILPKKSFSPTKKCCCLSVCRFWVQIKDLRNGSCAGQKIQAKRFGQAGIQVQKRCARKIIHKLIEIGFFWQQFFIFLPLWTPWTSNVSAWAKSNLKDW